MPGRIERGAELAEETPVVCMCIWYPETVEREEFRGAWITAKLQMPQEDLWKECQVHISIQNTRWADVPTDALLFFS